MSIVIMTIYEDVVFSPEVLADIADISKFIRTKNTKEAANKYIDYPEAKRMLTRNRKWNVVFHTEGKKVVVDKLIPSKLVTE